ncbi:autotransporter assembly complex family protein [uncultured Litoreibacter sp.]|uniref:autotransporter assembly complex protein TamA n=1 Tax=uncultured Litoreibacter sp. TaxID=1392394 RepID=UPI00261808BF|nr:autotransporter assembly complex family protein [uncultured Litoreibacter sp.]
MSRQLGLSILMFLALPAQLLAFELRFASSAGSSELNAELLAASLVAPLADKADASPQDVLAAAQADYGRLIGTLYEEGYFAPTINIGVNGREAAGISPLASPGAIQTVAITINPGARFQFGETAIAPIARGTELPADFSRGAVAKTGTIRDAVEAGIEGWRAAGHAKADIAEQRLIARHPARELDANIQLQPGPRLTFGNLVVRGNTSVRTGRIRDIAGLPSGRQFDPEEVRKATTRLRRTGAFKVAALSEAEKIGAGNTLDINAQIVEEKPRRFGFGAEISSTDGLGLSGFWLHRNLFGGAERLRLEGEIEGIGGQTGGADFKIGARFSRPATFNEDTDFFALTELESLDEESFSADRFKVEAGIRRYASDQREYTFGLGLQHARTEDAFGVRDYTIFTLPASAEFDYRDDPLNAKAGYYVFASVTPFVAIEGTESGVRTYLDGRVYKTVGAAENLTFALRGQLGSVSGPTLATAPADFLFYSGGGGTVRGQNYQSLGVDLGGGQEIGGRSFLGLSGEVRVKTGDKLSLVGFVDAGYVGAQAFPNGSDGDWHSGAGFGIRYDTGIGPIRVDLAVPVSGPGENSGFEVYIGIGQAF